MKISKLQGFISLILMVGIEEHRMLGEGNSCGIDIQVDVAVKRRVGFIKDS